MFCFLGIKCDRTAMMAATTSITIILGVHEKTTREGILSWGTSWSTQFLISRTKEAVTRIEMDFSGRKTELSTTRVWHLQYNLPLHYQITVLSAKRSPVDEAAVGHIESWNFDLTCFTESVVNVFGIVRGFSFFSYNSK